MSEMEGENSMKRILTLVAVVLFLAGFIMLAIELPMEASAWDIIAVNGGGVALLCTSLLILSKIPEDDSEQKGGKYYGI